MKSLFALVLATLLISAVEAPQLNNPALQQHLDTELNFERHVKIFNYEGDLVRELAVSNVSEGTISVIDYLVLEDSDYAFEIYGDYYYFTDKEVLGDLIN